ncbi:MAG: hypothetical protein ABI579_08075, partial [Candidatus Sumerlaeota bacterium]
MREPRKTSWIPLLAAFLVPAILMSGMAVVQWRRSKTMQVPDNSTINLLVHVVNKKGESLENKTVLVTRDDAKGAPSANPLTTK